MAATLLQERKKILQEQKNAAIKLNESLQRLPNFGAASNSFTKLNDAEQLTKKSLDELAARTSERWFKDPKIVKDYSVFVTSFYESLVAKMAVETPRRWKTTPTTTAPIAFKIDGGTIS